MTNDIAGRWWPAPAKLNLMLHIVGRRTDGYHLLQTLFQLLDVGDRLRFRSRADGQINRSNDVVGVPAEQDLTIRAATMLQQRSGTSQGADIEVDKRLPMGGGLGGGSSDAATALIVLDRLWGCGSSLDELAEIGLALGADVPLFVRGQSAWAEGIGEQLTPAPIPPQHFVVATPDCHVDTAALYADADLTRSCPKITMAAVLRGGGKNVFEPVVRKRYPECAELIDSMSKFGEARLTGSGASVFVACESATDASRIAAQLPSRTRAFVAQGRRTSPLHEQIGASPSW